MPPCHAMSIFVRALMHGAHAGRGQAGHGRVVQVDSIKIRVESAYCFRA